jgi:cellulose 1,4-beta-cellobiosidase
MISTARRLPRFLAAIAGLGLAASAAVVVLGNPATAASGCRVSYTVNQWNTGFTGNLVVTNLGDPITGGWSVTWDFAGDQQVQQGWNGVVSQAGRRVTAQNPPWSDGLGTGATATPGFNASYSGVNTAPADFALNGVPCTSGAGSPSSTASASPTGSPSPTGTPTPTPTASPPPPGIHVDNPYAGARGYVNPEWSAKASAEPGGSRIANTSTGVWLDRIAAIEGTGGSSSNGSMGLRDHLDAALSQAGGQPLTVQFVIYNLPNRDCSALASNGELKIAQDGLQRYKTEYIDPIAAIQADPRYRPLRIVNIIEIDSLPNLVTNKDLPLCAEAISTGAYVDGVRYALDKLHAIPNAYNYVDAAHSGWLGWDSNLGPAVDLWASTIKGTAAGVDSVDGFITNTANYTPIAEPFLPNSSLTIGGNPIRSAKFYEWNPYLDERTFGAALRSGLIAAGFRTNLGILVDTSRNGWGGAARPTAVSTSSDVNTYVNESRVDPRFGRGNWCNQSGAGLGQRPVANPAPGFDAYVWIKPPGESDGSSSLIPNDEGKGFDRMCDPTYTGNPRNNNQLSGALPDAPISGAWFSAQFRQLMANAHPAL